MVLSVEDLMLRIKASNPPYTGEQYVDQREGRVDQLGRGDEHQIFKTNDTDCCTIKHGNDCTQIVVRPNSGSSYDAVAYKKVQDYLYSKEL